MGICVYRVRDIIRMTKQYFCYNYKMHSFCAYAVNHKMYVWYTRWLTLTLMLSVLYISLFFPSLFLCPPVCLSVCLSLSHIHCESKKLRLWVFAITLPNTDRFSTFLYCDTIREICSKLIIKNSVSLTTRRYTTLWKINVRMSAGL